MPGKSSATRRRPTSQRTAPKNTTSKKATSKKTMSQNKKGAGQNQLRIIGGQWRGRKVPFPDGEGLRPTGDRMRETLFNWLSFSLPGARVLDLFAGSGALGLEALSRGAAMACFLDTHAGVVHQLRENLNRLNCGSAEVILADARHWIAGHNTEQKTIAPFDVVFLDPPFGQNLLEPICQQLDLAPILADDARIYIEAERGYDFSGLPSHWALLKEKQAGQVICRLYRVIRPAENAN